MRTLVSFFAILGFATAAEPTDAAKKELTKLDGEWSMVSGERDGQKVPEDLLKTGKRVMKDGETTVSFGDMVYLKAKVTIDPTKKPKTIDYAVSEGLAKGEKVLGIYELDGDTVKFCFAHPGKPRPTDFTATEDSGHTLSVWKRNKK